MLGRMKSVLLADPSLERLVMVYIKVGVIFTIAVLAIYFLFNRSGHSDSALTARLRGLLSTTPFRTVVLIQLAWIVLSLAAIWPRTLYRVIRHKDSALD
jgi:hypothetical protein